MAPYSLLAQSILASAAYRSAGVGNGGSDGGGGGGMDGPEAAQGAAGRRRGRLGGGDVLARCGAGSGLQRSRGCRAGRHLPLYPPLLRDVLNVALFFVSLYFVRFPAWLSDSRACECLSKTMLASLNRNTGGHSAFGGM